MKAITVNISTFVKMTGAEFIARNSYIIRRYEDVDKLVATLEELGCKIVSWNNGGVLFEIG